MMRWLIAVLVLGVLGWIYIQGGAVRYFHPAFEKFDSENFDLPEIQAFRDDSIILNVVVDVYIKPRDNKVWLYGYSKEPGQKIIIQNVEFLSGGKTRFQEQIETEVVIDRIVEGQGVYFIDFPIIQGLTRRYFRPWSGPVVVKVTYVFNGQEKTLTYKLDREVIRIGTP